MTVMRNEADEIVVNAERDGRTGDLCVKFDILDVDIDGC